MKLIAHAAEAKIFLSHKKIIKHRVPKGYRLLFLDLKLRKQRTRREARLLQKASFIIPVPHVLNIDEEKNIIEMEQIKGNKIAECIDSLPLSKSLSICKIFGTHLASLHDAGIIHGDLTTSNMILSKKNKIYFIDFGLGFESQKPEDKAVDIHVFKETLEARHCRKARKYFSAMLTGYKISKNYKETLARLSEVEKRGRYKRSY